MKTASLDIALFLIAFYFAFSHESALCLGLCDGSPLISRFTYMLAHDNIFHLFVNIYGFLTLFFISRCSFQQFAFAMIIAMAIPTCLLSDKPIIGISVLNFAMTGIVIAHNSAWRMLLVTNMAIIIAGLILPHIAALPHMFGFVAGFIYGLMDYNKE